MLTIVELDRRICVRIRNLICFAASVVVRMDDTYACDASSALSEALDIIPTESSEAVVADFSRAQTRAFETATSVSPATHTPSTTPNQGTVYVYASRIDIQKRTCTVFRSNGVIPYGTRCFRRFGIRKRHGTELPRAAAQVGIDKNDRLVYTNCASIDDLLRMTSNDASDNAVSLNENVMPFEEIDGSKSIAKPL